MKQTAIPCTAIEQSVIKKHLTVTQIVSFLLLLIPLFSVVHAETKLTDFLTDSQAEFKLRFTHYIDKSDLEPKRNQWESILNFTFSGDLYERSDGSTIGYTLKPVLHADDTGFSSKVIDSKTELHDEYYLLNFSEAFINISSDNMEWSIGKQIYNWGTADGYNPTDNINPAVLLNIPNRFKIGVPALSFAYEESLFSLDAVLIPWFTPVRFPTTDNRWFGDLNEASALFPATPLVLGGWELPGDDLNNAQWAVRLKSSELMLGWDWAISFFDGIDSVGIMRSDPAPTHVLLTRVFPKYREFGLSFSTTWWELELHGEAAIHMTDNEDMDDDYLEYIVGLNYTFYWLLPDYVEQSTLILEYADEDIIDEKVSTSQFVSTGQFVRPFKNTLIAQVAVQLFDELRVEVFGSYNLKEHDAYTGLKLLKKIRDNWEVTLGANFFSGDDDTFYGTWRKNDSVYTSLTHTF